MFIQPEPSKSAFIPFACRCYWMYLCIYVSLWDDRALMKNFLVLWERSKENTYCKIDSLNGANCKAFVAHIASAAQYLMAIHYVELYAVCIYVYCYTLLPTCSFYSNWIKIFFCFYVTVASYFFPPSILYCYWLSQKTANFCFFLFVSFCFCLFQYVFYFYLYFFGQNAHFLHIDARYVYEHTCPCSIYTVANRIEKRRCRRRRRCRWMCSWWFRLYFSWDNCVLFFVIFFFTFACFARFARFHFNLGATKISPWNVLFFAL